MKINRSCHFTCLIRSSLSISGHNEHRDDTRSLQYRKGTSSRPWIAESDEQPNLSHRRRRIHWVACLRESGDMTQFRQKLGSCPPIPGYLPIAFDNLVYGHRDLVKWGPFEEGDITDSTRLDGVMEKYQPDAVLHFAGFAYVGESVQKPDKYYRNNVVGSLTLLESMIKHRIRSKLSFPRRRESSLFKGLTLQLSKGA